MYTDNRAHVLHLGSRCYLKTILIQRSTGIKILVLTWDVDQGYQFKSSVAAHRASELLYANLHNNIQVIV